MKWQWCTRRLLFVLIHRLTVAPLTWVHTVAHRRPLGINTRSAMDTERATATCGQITSFTGRTFVYFCVFVASAVAAGMLGISVKCEPTSFPSRCFVLCTPVNGGHPLPLATVSRASQWHAMAAALTPMWYPLFFAGICREHVSSKQG